MTASPMNFSTVPPYRSMIARAVSNQPPSRSRTVSASRVSAMAVEPTRSTNRIETRRRSAPLAVDPDVTDAEDETIAALPSTDVVP